VNINNTHPHTDSKGEFWIVHNGIIEDAEELKKQLIEKGYKFYSETDTEVVAKLLEDNYTGDLLETVEKVLPKLE
jgi:glucosamine--fructose-6-phosphate aminotransferase (isomerizing)